VCIRGVIFSSQLFCNRPSREIREGEEAMNFHPSDEEEGGAQAEGISLIPIFGCQID
jgi:hypothetical protein